jgi:hypothetical protein
MKEISRRKFLKGAAGVSVSAAAAGVLGTGLGFASGEPDAVTSASVNTSASGGSGESVAVELPDFLTAPDPIADSEISSTVTADVVVVGCGLAGLMAARSASEAGASVVVVEKSNSYNYRSGQFGICGSTLQKERGMDFDGSAAVGDLMKEMGYRPDQRIWNYWRDYSGQAFDWLLEPAGDNVDVIDMYAKEYDPSKITVATIHWPKPEAYNSAEEFSPTYPAATLTFIPDQGNVLELSYQRCLEQGVDFHFATWAKQLIRPDNQGRVQGVIGQDLDGNYIQFIATKGVIMAAGDYGSNTDMVKHFCGGRTYSTMFTSTDARGATTNLGEGQCMGAWVGAKIEDGPHAPMTHTLGGALGVDPFLLLNADGCRFCNEDVAGQQLSTQLYRQREDWGWSIFDDNYPDQVELMGCSHGSVNHILPAEDVPNLSGAVMTIGRSAITSRSAVEKSCTMADSIEELAAKLYEDETAQKNLIAAVQRYNELCQKGIDEDFNKVSKRMFPLEKAPFYATKISAGSMLVCLGGLSVDPVTMKVVDEDINPIDGLYAVGNNMGGRILQDYPVTIAGASHGTCLTFGYLVGRKVAES